MFPTTKTTTNDRDATFPSPFFAFHRASMHFPHSFFQTGPLFSDEYDLNGNENFDDENNNFFSTQTLLRRKRVTAKQFHFPSQTFLRYFWYARFGLIVCAEPCGGRNDDVDGFLRKVRSMGTTIPTDDHGGFRRRGQQQQQQRQREENSYYWYRRGGGGGGRGRIPKPREGRGGGGRGGAKFYRHFSPSSSFRGDATRGLGGGVGGAGFRHHRDEGASSGEDGGAWSMVPLISASSRSSSSTCSSSQISSYGGMNIPYYGSPYVDYEAAFGLSPSFRRIGGRQSSTKRRLRRLEERIALGINLDENGIPFDRELTEEQRERLFEFRAFKKELERSEPFVENAEALGLFLEYEEEKNVLLLGCGTSSSSSSSSLSGSPSSTTTAVHSSSSKSGSDNTNDENTDSTDDDDDENKEDNVVERENRYHQNDKNDSNDIENEHSCFDLETFVKDVAERLHVDDDSIDSETEYKDGNSKGTSSGVSSLDVSHEQQ
ncbi:unnamed protein product [Bathycoccus prasinos]